MTCKFKVNLLCLLQLLQLTFVTYGAPSNYTYVESTNGFYQLHMEQKSTWAEAVAKCASEGAILYFPEHGGDVHEVTTALGVWKHYFVSIWVGMSDLRVKRRYETVDGRDIDKLYHRWDTKFNQPKAGPKKDHHCGLLYYDGHLWMEECNSRQNFVCKYTEEGNITTTEIPN